MKKRKKDIFDHSLDVSRETMKQFEECYSQDFVTAAALMPDAHKGYVAPIGAVLITKNYIVPAWVGFDIGCGMIALRLKGKNLLEKIRENQDEIFRKVEKKVPMGLGKINKTKNITKKTKKEFEKLLKEFEEGEYDKEILKFLKENALKHLGSLGSGNHFIEIGHYEKEVWLIIHSGSRKIGHRVAKRYMIKASSNKKDYERTFPLRDTLKFGKEYLNVLDFGLKYALLNRLEIAKKVVELIEKVLGEKIKAKLWVNKNHNHAVYEKGKYIHRKGATPAKKRERGVIPGNMRDGSYLVKGLGNKEFLESSSHGAGRALSRKAAKKKISMKQFKKSMEGIKANITEKIIDESPMAYKDIDKIMKAQKESVKIIKYLEPVINWKA